MIIDLIVGFVLLVSAGISFFRGFIREVLTIAGVAAGGFMAIVFGGALSPVFKNWLGVDPEATETEKLFDIIPMPIVADICAYASIFIIVVIVVALISHFTSGAIKAMGLGPIDRTLGVIFGIVRALLLLSLLYLPFHKLMSDEAKEEYFGKSKTHIYIANTAGYIAQFLPESKDKQSDVSKEGTSEKSSNNIKNKLYKNDFLKNEDGAGQQGASQDNLKKEMGYEQKERERLESLFERPTVN